MGYLKAVDNTINFFEVGIRLTLAYLNMYLNLQILLAFGLSS